MNQDRSELHYRNILNDAAKFIEGRDPGGKASTHALQNEIDAARRDGTWNQVLDKLKTQNLYPTGFPLVAGQSQHIDFSKGVFESSVDGKGSARQIDVDLTGKNTKARAEVWESGHLLDAVTGDIIFD